MKIIKFIKFIIANVFMIIIAKILSCTFTRDSKYITFNANIDNGKKELFLHNTKYLFLYLNKENQYILNWLCDDNCMRNYLREKGFKNVHSRKSLKGIYYALKSEYWFYDFQVTDLPRILTDGAVLINLWHGASGLKKCGFDERKNIQSGKLMYLKNAIYNRLRIKDSYYIVNSEYEIKCRKTAFNASINQFILLSSPRLDSLYNDIDYADLFMEEDFKKIKTLKEEGKTLFIYMPTFRDTGKNISNWLKSKKLKYFLKNTNAVLICKLHPFDKNLLDFDLGDEFYKMKINSDVHPILKYTDAMITDYSGVYFDYLHLDKPIIYYVPDLYEYETQCRGFYRAYDTLIAGVRTKTEEELLNAMKDVINNVDNFKTIRKELLNEMFVFQDGNSCKRVIDWIRSLK